MKNFYELKKKLFLLAIFISAFVGYFFFYFHANVHGPRYFFEVVPFLTLLFAKGVAESSKYFHKKEILTAPNFVTALFLTAPVFYFSIVIPETIPFYQKGFWGVGEGIKKEIELRDIHNSVIFAFPYNRETPGNGLIFMNLSDPEKSDNILVKDLGDAVNSKYMHYMKGRKFYRAEYLPHKFDTVKLQEIFPTVPETFIRIEMEDKFPPFADRVNPADYCNTVPLHESHLNFVDFPDMKSMEFTRWALFCRFSDKNEEYNFGQYFFVSGKYSVKIKGVTGKSMGKIDFFIDDEKVISIDFNSENSYELNEFVFETEIKSGFRNLKIKPALASVRNNKKTYFIIDWIEFDGVEKR